MFRTSPILLILIISSFSVSCSSSEKVWNITDYGAKGDSATINTDFIQTAIDNCSKSGGGTVLIDNGTYITGTILLKNNVTLNISENSKLIGSDNPSDYQSIDPFIDATGQLRGKCLIGAINVIDIAIIGKGTIDGRGTFFLRENLRITFEKYGVDKSNFNQFASNRPFLIRFVKSKGITMTDIHLRQPAAWTVHFYQCGDILVDGIDIYSHAHRNNDGIDLDSSNDAIIKNCNIDAGDDAICFKATSSEPCFNIQVSNCKLKSDWGAIKFGTESMGDFRDISIKNCSIYDTKGGGIKILSVDGANINNINIEDITMENVDMPIFIRLGERLRTYRDAPKQEVGSINNVTIKNVNAYTRNIDNSRIQPPSGILITGTPNHKIGTINLENIKIDLPGGGLAEHNKNVVPENEIMYPEFISFGILPVSGIMARHVQNISMNKLNFTLKSKDRRELKFFDDVDKKEFVK